MTEKQDKTEPTQETKEIRSPDSVTAENYKTVTWGEMWESPELTARVLEFELDDFLKSESMQRITEIFPDAMEWVEQNRKDDGPAIVYTLEDLAKETDGINKYINDKGLTRSLSAFLTVQPDRRGEMSSAWDNYPPRRELAEKFDLVMELAEIRQGKKYRYPKKHAVPHDYMSTNLMAANNQGEMALYIPYKNTSIESSFEFSTVLGTVNGVTIYGDYGPMEQETYRALCTLWLNNTRLFTINQLCRVLYKKPKMKSPPAETKEHVLEWLNELEHTSARLDVTEWAKKMGLPFKGYNAPLIEISMLDEGEGKELQYFIRHKPIVLDYAERTDQLWTIPAEYFEIRKVNEHGQIIGSPLNMNQNRLAIVGRLVDRIKIAQYKKAEAREKYEKDMTRSKRKGLPPKKTLAQYESNYSKIMFDDIFTAARLDGLSDVEKGRYRNFMLDCFAFWKSVGFISGYEIIQGDRKNTILGVKIE